MKRFILSAISIFLVSNLLVAQSNKEPWSNDQLLDPAILAQKINQKKVGNMLIVSIGPDAVIKGSVEIGPGGETKNINKLKAYLKNVSKDKEVVIY